MNFVRSFVRPASRILPGFRAASLTHLPQQQQQANLRLSATRFNALPRGFSSAASAEASVEEAAPSKDSKAIPFNEPFTPRKGIMYPNYRFVMLAPGRKLRSNQVIFKVPLQLNKFQIKNYLEEVYSVKVIKVETAIMLGKRKMNNLYTMQRRYVKLGDWKKAYVTLDHEFKFPELQLIRQRKNNAADKARQEYERKTRPGRRGQSS